MSSARKMARSAKAAITRPADAQSYAMRRASSTMLSHSRVGAMRMYRTTAWRETSSWQSSTARRSPSLIPPLSGATRVTATRPPTCSHATACTSRYRRIRITRSAGKLPPMSRTSCWNRRSRRSRIVKTRLPLSTPWTRSTSIATGWASCREPSRRPSRKAARPCRGV